MGVIGFGRSGSAVLRRLIELGAEVFVSEQKPLESFDAGSITELKALTRDLEFGGHSERLLSFAKLLIVSPGVHLDIPILAKARKRGIKILSEIDFAFSLLSKPLIAVTGTNGKTTTTTLIGEMLKAAGKRVVVCGNIGYPISAVDDSDLDLIVAEISSYQLEASTDFKPWISVMLNITEDHIERHKTMEGYMSAKARVFTNQTGSDHLIYNFDDPLVAELSKRSPAKLLPFSRTNKLDEGVYLEGSRLVARVGNNKFDIIDKKDIFIKGDHNVENALAASSVAILSGVDAKVIAKVLKDFKGVEHRIEFVAKISGVSFYNDSKGTNPDSSIVALRALGNNVILIAGGRDKGSNLSKLIDEAKPRVKAMMLIGEASERFKNDFSRSGFKPIYEEKSMEAAVKKAAAIAASGDQVLLSPACASFDMFTDYEERGRVFKHLVKSLEEEKAT